MHEITLLDRVKTRNERDDGKAARSQTVEANMLNATFNSDVDYALRMIRSGCATVEQAARTCGIPVAILKTRLASAASSASSEAGTRRLKSFKKVSA
jgi:hypothetical protein